MRLNPGQPFLSHQHTPPDSDCWVALPRHQLHPHSSAVSFFYAQASAPCEAFLDCPPPPTGYSSSLNLFKYLGFFYLVRWWSLWRDWVSRVGMWCGLFCMVSSPMLSSEKVISTCWWSHRRKFEYSPRTKCFWGTCLVVQWLRIHLAMKGTQVWSLIEKPRSHLPWSN